MIKHDFVKIWQKWPIWQRIKMKIVNAKSLMGNDAFLNPFKEAENRSSIYCLVCVTDHIKKTLNLF